MAIIPWRCLEIVDIVCIFEKELPTSFLDFQVHILIHLINEVELARLVSCCRMLFFQRHVKKLKGFVQKMEKFKGSYGGGVHNI